MRDLTSSMLKMSWALPLFGIRQMINLSVPTKGNQENTTRSLDAVSQAAQGELGSTFQRLYNTGDKLQRELIDATFKLLPLDMVDPTRWIQGGIPGMGPSPPSPLPPSSPAPAPSSSASGGSSESPATSGGPSVSPPVSGGWGPMPS